MSRKSYMDSSGTRTEKIHVYKLGLPGYNGGVTSNEFHSPPPGVSARERGLLRAWGPFVGLVGTCGFLLGAVWGPEALRGTPAGGAGLLLAAAGIWWTRRRAVRLLARYERGAEGEERVAEALSRLPGDWRVFHGVPGGDGDLDHVVTGPAGLCVIETIRWNGRVDVREGALRDDGRAYPGYELDTLSGRARGLAGELDAGSAPVWTFVAVAGGRLVRDPGQIEGVWLVEAEALPNTLRELPPAGLTVEQLDALNRKLEKRYA